MERWVVAAKRADFAAIGKEFGIDPVIARLIRNRDVQDRDEIRRYLYGKVDELASPHLMKDVDKAVEILRNKIKEKKRIRIIGDYDIDGVVSTFILIKGLKRAGALADTYIPDRVADGYGIHEHLIERAVNDGIDVIVTCDNGIAAYNEITMAKEKGMTVIITDHHEIPYKETEDGRELILPPADAIVNPKTSYKINNKKVSKKKYYAEYKKMEKKYPLKQISLKNAFNLTTKNIKNITKNYKSFVVTGAKY